MQNSQGATALVMASKGGHAAVVKELLEGDADMNLTTQTEGVGGQKVEKTRWNAVRRGAYVGGGDALLGGDDY